MKEVCAACYVEVTSDTKVCPICKEPVGTVMIPEKPCPQGGDNSDCESCVYYPQHAWNEDEEDCIAQELKTYHVTVKVLWTQAVEAYNEELAKQETIDTFKEEFNLDLDEKEIIEVEEQK